MSTTRAGVPVLCVAVCLLAAGRVSGQVDPVLPDFDLAELEALPDGLPPAVVLEVPLELGRMHPKVREIVVSCFANNARGAVRLPMPLSGDLTTQIDVPLYLPEGTDPSILIGGQYRCTLRVIAVDRPELACVVRVGAHPSCSPLVGAPNSLDEHHMISIRGRLPGG